MTYRPSPIKRSRRTRAEIDVIRDAIYSVLAEDYPMTVRQVFYRLVSRGSIAKTEAEYKQTVCRLLTEMRRDGSIPWGWITDFTRTMRKPRTFSGLEHAVQATAEHYRRALWYDLDIRVEVWLEKDALAGVLYQETSRYDVPLMVTRGYPSLSFLHGAGEEIEEDGKPTFIYYFGDHDPSGVDIPRKVEAGLREFAPTTEIHFERVAVTPEQIERLGLPTRPTKATDSRSRTFDGESVEVDAILPRTLRALCRRCIEGHLTENVLRAHRAAEESERQLLTEWAASIGGAA
jgi:hypothetical protein